MKKDQVANFHGQASDAYACLNGARYFIFMDNTLKPVSNKLPCTIQT
jgi:hypothetical protein